MKQLKTWLVVGFALAGASQIASADGFGFNVGGYYNSSHSFGPSYSAPRGSYYRPSYNPNPVTGEWFENIGIQRRGVSFYSGESMEERRSRVWGYWNGAGHGGGWDHSFEQHFRFR